tara:strand:+ start:6550 stop:7002 length:453 start_codon:yes stop_codon:yes gene_type:complete
MEFETHVAKFVDHEVYSSVSPKLPTVRLFNNEKYALAVALHKWKNETSDVKQKGEFIAVYIVCHYGDSWDEMDFTDTYHVVQSESDFIRNIEPSSFESGTYDDERIQIFKFSVNVWRKVEYIGKKVKKWTFVDSKPEKDSPSQIQRLLCH